MSELSALFLSVKLPVMPEVAQALIRTLHDENVDMETVQKILSKDPTLTAKVLQFANSAGFGVRREISSLQSAISIVGMAKVRTIALSACMNVAFPVVPGLDRTQFWKHCMTTAAYAQSLAPLLAQDEQQAWLAGLMLRLGEVLIGMHRPELIMEIERPPATTMDRWQREEQLLGFTENEVTAELAHRWRFPLELIQGLAATTHPLRQPVPNRLGAVLHLAACLADMSKEALVSGDGLPQKLMQALMLEHAQLLDALPSNESMPDLASI